MSTSDTNDLTVDVPIGTHAFGFDDDILSILTVYYKILLKIISTVNGRNHKAKIDICMHGL